MDSREEYPYDGNDDPSLEASDAVDGLRKEQRQWDDYEQNQCLSIVSYGDEEDDTSTYENDRRASSKAVRFAQCFVVQSVLDLLRAYAGRRGLSLFVVILLVVGEVHRGFGSGAAGCVNRAGAGKVVRVRLLSVLIRTREPDWIKVLTIKDPTVAIIAPTPIEARLPASISRSPPVVTTSSLLSLSLAVVMSHAMIPQKQPTTAPARHHTRLAFDQVTQRAVGTTCGI